MTGEWFPTCWSWPDQNDQDHWVVEGTALELDGARKPVVRALCGQRVAVCRYQVRRVYCNLCDSCHLKLTNMIAAAMDG